MNHYDPDKVPDRNLWLLLDERERIRQVEEFHHRAGVKTRNIKLHAVFHALVEIQNAEGLNSVVHAMVRLQTQGLSRHDSIHAISWVLSQHFHDLLDAIESDNRTAVLLRYDAAIDRLDVATWRAQAHHH